MYTIAENSKVAIIYNVLNLYEYLNNILFLFYRTHEKIHTGDFTYECQVCSKKFPARIPLQNHLRTHTGDKAFKCDTCGKSYNYINNLKV